MDREAEKLAAAKVALAYLPENQIIGIGTGSTVNHLIDLLATRKTDIEAAVSSSEASTKRLKAIGIKVVELNHAGDLPIYFDGADEVDSHRRLIKGGGGALTREKIIAAASKKFVCMVDSSKEVAVLGKFPLPVEVIPMARSFVARQLVKLGGQPVWRDDYLTDNGNPILDVHNLSIVDPETLERTINQIPGVVTVGLFAIQKPQVLIVGDKVKVG
jgi:ribose 5-phosphate isomerase A